MKGIVFKRPNEAVFDEIDELPDSDTIIQNDYTLVSAGTELAVLSGGESWAPLPFQPGYASVGTVLSSGQRYPYPYPKGTRVFTHGKHAEQTAPSVMCVRVPDSLEGQYAVFARLASVSITAIRLSRIEIGDWVAVYGAGLVGNFAAQLARLSGARVIIVDQSKQRLSIAQKCGIKHCIHADGTELDQISRVTMSQKCSTVIEATGKTSVVERAIDAASCNGELILLGTPREEFQTDLGAFLRTIHLANSGVKVIGAHEWRYPVTLSEAKLEKHSIERNTMILMELIDTGALEVEELLSEVVSPHRVAEVYQTLARNSDEYLGVVFDWTGERQK